MERAKSFEARLARIFEATRASSDSALARLLDIQPQSVAAARKRGQIPSSWVEKVSENFGVSANWLFFGTGPMKDIDAQQATTKLTVDSIEVSQPFTWQEAGASIPLQDIAEQAEALQRQDLAALAKAKEEEAAAYQRKAQALGEAAEILENALRVQGNIIQTMQSRIDYYEKLLPHMGNNPFGAPRVAEEVTPPPALQTGQSQKIK